MTDYIVTYRFINEEGFTSSRTIVLSKRNMHAALIELSKLISKTAFDVKIIEEQSL